MHILYRSRQLWLALTARPTLEGLAQAEEILNESLMALFKRMQPSEQAHSLKICRKLIAQGEDQPDLLVAALLHDVGKTCYPLKTWERVVVVLCRAFIPGQVHAWGKGTPDGWRKAFVVAEQHPDWGAQLAAQTGASPLTVAIIRYHQNDSPQFTQGDEQLKRCLSRLKTLDEEY